MIIGTPKNLKAFVCVNSEQGVELHRLGFDPIYKDIANDKIFFIKTNEICKVVYEKWNLTKK